MASATTLVIWANRTGLARIEKAAAAWASRTIDSSKAAESRIQGRVIRTSRRRRISSSPVQRGMCMSIEQQVDGLFLQNPQSFLAVRRQQRPEAAGMEYIPQRLTKIVIVVGNQEGR